VDTIPVNESEPPHVSRGVSKGKEGPEMSKMLKLGAILAALSAAAVLGGCFPPPGVTVRASAPAVAYGYTPQYYDGYVVYYDNYGQPFYYMNGAPVYIPSSHPQYGVYVSHYHSYGPAYNQWYASHGAHYRAYRQPGYAPAPAPTVVVRPRGPVYAPAPAPAPTVVVRPRPGRPAPAPGPVYRPAPAPAPAPPPTVIVH
jgi:hypothetical protein